MNDALIKLVLMVIAGITIVSGLSQIAVPAAVLHLIGADAGETSRQLFATTGMCMVITVAMFLQALLTRSREPAIPLWIGVQKLAAAVLVCWGWSNGLFGALALVVAGFDLATGILVLVFLSRMKRPYDA